MELFLTVIRYQNHGSEQKWAARIGRTGGTIGRSADNDLVLPHSEVSRLHARLDFRDDNFYLTNISTNGTFVNNAAEPLRTGQAVALHEGDTLGIGPYDVQVSFEAARLQHAQSLDPFGSAEHEHEPVADTPGGTVTPDTAELLSECEPSKAAGPFAEPEQIPADNAFFRPPEAIPENYDILSDEFRPQPTGGDSTISDEQLLHAPSAPKPAAPADHLSDVIARKLAPPEHRVEFSVFVPARIVPGGAFVLDVWAYLAADYPHVCSWAKEVGRETLAGHRSGVNLLSGSILTVQVKLPGATITNPVDNIFWDGEPTNASFAVTVPVAQRPGVLLGKVIVQADGLTITKILFTVNVATEARREYVERSTQRVSINSAFASYAGEDRADVLARIQGMQKVVPDLDVFVDVFSLRSGDRWEQKLKDYVPTRDTFYLFWSKRASESVWVEREWRLALESRGLDYIDPVPLEEPRLAPPPPELAALHFADAYVSYIRYFHMSRGLSDALEPWSEFVKGAGIPGTNVPDGGTINEALAKAGALLRCLSEVVFDSVLGVSDLRQELSLPGPKPHPAGNNPFDFCFDADDLLKRLLAPSGSEWMDGRDAISAVSRDLRAHNAALLAGCQSVTKALMEALDPRSVHERTEEAKWLSAGLPVLKDARCWKAYQDRYEELQGTLFEKEGLLMKRFASAYQDKCHEVVTQKRATD